MPSIIYASPLILTTFMEGRNYYTYFTYEDTDAGKSWVIYQWSYLAKSVTSQTQVYQVLKDERGY